MKALAACVLLLGLTGLAACSGSDDGDRAADAAPDRPSASAPASPEAPSDGPSDESPGTDLATTDVCALVRAGVDAFNTGDVDGTIAEFEKAVGPAQRLARDEPSDETATLLEAVRYYADLPADQYVEANESSPEFQKFKAFTLTACDYGSVPDGATTPTETGIPA